MLTDEDRQWISEQLEGVETRLLTEFHRWASPVEMRVRSHTAALRALDIELSVGELQAERQIGASLRSDIEHLEQLADLRDRVRKLERP